MLAGFVIVGHHRREHRERKEDAARIGACGVDDVPRLRGIDTPFRKLELRHHSPEDNEGSAIVGEDRI